MIIRTKGIVFRSIKYSETSLILDIYTEEKGLRTYITSGVRKPRARIGLSTLQLMSIVDAVVYHRDDREMTRLKEARPAVVYQKIPFDIRRSSVGLFMIEVAQKSIKEKEANPDLFRLLERYFVFLDQTENSVRNVHLHFLLHLSTYLGFQPGGDFEEATPYFDLSEGVFVPQLPAHQNYLDEQLSAIFYQLLLVPLEQAYQVKIERGQRQSLLLYLLDYYRLHLDDMQTVNAHEILQEVLN